MRYSRQALARHIADGYDTSSAASLFNVRLDFIEREQRTPEYLKYLKNELGRNRDNTVTKGQLAKAIEGVDGQGGGRRYYPLNPYSTPLPRVYDKPLDPYPYEALNPYFAPLIAFDEPLSTEEIYEDGVDIVSKLEGVEQLVDQRLYNLISHLLPDQVDSLDWDAITGKPNFFSGRYPDLSDKPDTFPPAAHNHDGRYYTEDQSNLLLSEKSNADHAHDHTYFTQRQINEGFAPISTISATSPNVLAAVEGFTDEQDRKALEVLGLTREYVDLNLKQLSETSLPTVAHGMIISPTNNNEILYVNNGRSISRLDRATGTDLRRFAQGESSATDFIGITYDSTNSEVLSVDNNSNRWFRYGTDGTLLGVRNLSTRSPNINTLPTGITYNATSREVLVSDRRDPRYWFRYSTDGTYLGKVSLHSENTNPQGMTTISGNVLVVDGNGKVYVYEPDGTFIRAYNANLGGLTGISYDATNQEIWISNSARRWGTFEIVPHVKVPRITRLTGNGVLLTDRPFPNAPTGEVYYWGIAVSGSSQQSLQGYGVIPKSAISGTAS